MQALVRTLLFACNSSYLRQRKREDLLGGIIGKAKLNGLFSSVYQYPYTLSSFLIGKDGIL